MESIITGLGRSLAIVAIFVGSLIMATLTQTFAENIVPGLKDKRNLLFWVWLLAWLAIFTAVMTALRSFLEI